MFALRPHVSATDTEHGMVLLDERTGRYWQLNATGATVVRLLLGGHGVPDAVTALTTAHPEAAERVADDVEALLRALREARVVA
ncbi:lasso peptide biosynthesis PqqD family chaperone [Allostreptomyces psammosilenae]|uniref:Lasso peptide biosynthesis PqqD family chaperone n=1 Tax=Allostreptomyces psammosilenae TaxID=1892865 RepID=A0A853A2C2_9ACTN|nr:lasso peptide biosynthesis PqqD family chaperone [Allostreptomyces psammosilenae]NYI07610.1 hypothetical protein [Allostreptomyces psammosilenae]